MPNTEGLWDVFMSKWLDLRILSFDEPPVQGDDDEEKKQKK